MCPPTFLDAKSEGTRSFLKTPNVHSFIYKEKKSGRTGCAAARRMGIGSVSVSAEVPGCRATLREHCWRSAGHGGGCRCRKYCRMHDGQREVSHLPFSTASSTASP